MKVSSESSTGCVPLGRSLSLFIDFISEHEGIPSGATGTRIRIIAFDDLRMLCGRIGYLPKSHLLFNKFDLSGMPCAPGPVNIQMGVFKGRDAALKSLGVSEVDDKIKTRRLNQATTSHQGSLT